MIFPDDGRDQPAQNRPPAPVDPAEKSFLPPESANQQRGRVGIAGIHPAQPGQDDQAAVRQPREFHRTNPRDFLRDLLFAGVHGDRPPPPSHDVQHRLPIQLSDQLPPLVHGGDQKLLCLEPRGIKPKLLREIAQLIPRQLRQLTGRRLGAHGCGRGNDDLAARAAFIGL
jgi:hypothetical protein